jgi:hypothetical protein
LSIRQQQRPLAVTILRSKSSALELRIHNSGGQYFGRSTAAQRASLSSPRFPKV